ncbi:hypothetical protein, partial [Calidithermus chliarophilus]|uniref:hypothetical protein n=1 Tax=Calidithermus chliarophilus TaxID=52023 RepID=UPI00056D84CD
PPPPAGPAAEPGPSPAPEPPLADDAGDGFTPLEGVQPEGAVPADEGEGQPQEKPNPLQQLEPYSDEEIMGGAALAAMFVLKARGAGLKTEQEVSAFERAFAWVEYPILKTSRLLEPLKLGEALREFGIAKGNIPGLSKGGDAPAWVRLLVGGVGLGLAMWNGTRAVAAERAKEKPKGGKGA